VELLIKLKVERKLVELEVVEKFTHQQNQNHPPPSIHHHLNQLLLDQLEVLLFKQ